LRYGQRSAFIYGLIGPSIACLAGWLGRDRFIDEHEAEAPFGFPEIGKLIGALQAASSKGSDPHGMAPWAGTAFRKATAG
jgi:hypothetical protein